MPAFNSVFNDEVVDGTTYQGQVDPGVDRNLPLPTGDDKFLPEAIPFLLNYPILIKPVLHSGTPGSLTSKVLAIHFRNRVK